MSRLDPEFEELYRREFLSVFRAAYLLSGSTPRAEDATQEAFARAYERWGRLKNEPWVGGWIMRTAINLVRRGLRRRPAPSMPDAATRDVDGVVDLWRAVAALPKRQRAAIVLVYRAGLSTQEAARVLGCKPSTLRASLTRARRVLADRLKEDGDERGQDRLPRESNPTVGP